MLQRRGVPTIPVPVLRDAVALAITELSLRGAAKQMGISPNGLRSFIKGSGPRSTKRGKLEGWRASLGHRCVPRPTAGPLDLLLPELSGGPSPQMAVLAGRRCSAG